MKNSRLSPQPASKKTLEEQVKEYLASLSLEDLEKFMLDVQKIKDKKNEQT